MLPTKDGFNLLLRSFGAVAVVMIVGCGRSDENELQQQDIFSDGVQREIVSVLANANNAIVDGSVEQNELTANASCKPKVGLILVGISLKFTKSDTCVMDGDINIKLLPPTAEVALEIAGLDHVESLNFDADISLKKENQKFEVGFEVIDGRISLKNLKLLPFEEMILVGSVAYSSDSANLSLNSRMNVLTSDSGSGMAFITNISKDKNTGVGTKTIQACFLTGGSPTDPNAGEMGRCFSLGK